MVGAKKYTIMRDIICVFKHSYSGVLTAGLLALRTNYKTCPCGSRHKFSFFGYASCGMSLNWFSYIFFKQRLRLFLKSTEKKKKAASVPVAVKWQNFILLNQAVLAGVSNQMAAHYRGLKIVSCTPLALWLKGQPAKGAPLIRSFSSPPFSAIVCLSAVTQ